MTCKTTFTNHASYDIRSVLPCSVLARRDPERCLASQHAPRDGVVQDVGVAEECNERFRSAMEDTWCIVPSLRVALSAGGKVSAIAAPEPESEQQDATVPAPPVNTPSSRRHGEEQMSPASSVLSLQSSGSSSDGGSSETASSPVTPASSPDMAGGAVRGMTRSGSLGNLLDKFPDQLEPSPEPRPERAQLAAPVERRKTCFDLAAQVQLPGGLFFGAVYDGHGGRECSEFLRERMHVNLAREIAFGADPRLAVDDTRHTRHIHDAMLSAYLMTDIHCRKAGITSGSTAVTAVVNRGVDGRRWIHVGNVGDAAAIVCRQCPMEGMCKRENREPQAIRLSVTHRPCVQSERERVTEAGGFILRQRVLGVLAVTRAMGNHSFKSGQDQQTGIIARPSCKSMELDPHDRFVVLASDGLTDVLSDQSIVETVCSGVHKMRAASVKRGRPVKHAATTLSKLLINKALQCGANDNITAMVIIL
jgi:protein phosphatase